MHKKKRAVVFSLFSLVVSVMLMAVSLYAWFNLNRTRMSGVDIRFTKIYSNGYIVDSVNNERPDSSDYVIYPGDIFSLKLTVVENTRDFGIRIAVEVPEKEDFVTLFTEKTQYLFGQYLKADRSVDDSSVFLQPYGFDVQRYLKNKGLTDEEEIVNRQIDLLYKFATENTIHSAMRLTLTHIDGEPVDSQYGALKRIDGATENKDVFYTSTPQPFTIGQELVITVEYGRDVFTPFEAEFTDQDMSIFGNSKYLLLNHNCFIGNKLNVSFENQRPLTP